MAYDNQPQLTLTEAVKEYIDQQIKHERELTDARNKFVDEKFIAIEEARKLAIASIEEARKLAKTEQDRRLDGMNEFREQLNVQATTFMAREVYEREHKGLTDTITAKFSTQDDKFETALKPLQTFVNQTQGSQATKNWLVPSGPVLITLIIAIIGMVLAISNFIHLGS
jgi:hypothetical protein